MQRQKKCEWCWKDFVADDKRVKYCSLLCKNQHRYQKSKSEKSYVKICKQCWKEFTTPNKNVSLCSLECRWRYAAINWEPKRKLHRDVNAALEKRRATREKNWWHPMHREDLKQKAMENAAKWRTQESIQKQIESKKKTAELKWFWECVCEVCWKHFIKRTTWQQKFCSYECKLKSLNMRRKKDSLLKECVVCWKEFSTSHPNQTFCSIECKNKDRNQKAKEERLINRKELVKICWCCWKEFITHHSWFVYCSDYCRQYAEKTKRTLKKSHCIDCWCEISVYHTRCKSCNMKKQWLDKPDVMYNATLNNMSKVWFITKPEEKRKNFIEQNTWKEVEQQFNIVWINYKWEKQWYRFDLKVGNILIDIDPTRSHNSTYFPKESWPKEMHYHQFKSLSAERLWYYPIHLFDWDDNDVVKQWLIWLIKWRKRLYHWEVKKISSQDAAEFYDANHLQWRVWAKTHYWLFVKWKLINAMSFTQRKNTKTWVPEWFLERFASLQWYKIAHGAEKLFNTFIKEYDPDYVISYSDITKHSWWLYNALWFDLELEYTKPSYWRVETKTNTPYRRRLCQKKNMHNLPGFDPNFKYEWNEDNPYRSRTESDLMESNWYVVVYDCWNRRHVWHKKDLK